MFLKCNEMTFKGKMLSKGDVFLYKRWSGQSVSSSNLSEKKDIIKINSSKTCTTMGDF